MNEGKIFLEHASQHVLPFARATFLERQVFVRVVVHDVAHGVAGVRGARQGGLHARQIGSYLFPRQ